MVKKNCFFILIFVFLICPASAITIGSESYSVDRVNSGLQASTITSESYQAEISLDYSGTGDAESELYLMNIGFNTPSTSSVFIKSYSISPDSISLGSSLSLYVSASGAQSVWADIIYPDSQEEILNLINNDYTSYSPSVIGGYEVIFYANSSSGAVASVIDSFTVIELVQEKSSSGGHKTNKNLTEECYYNWSCGPWSSCSEGEQKRECKNLGTCNETEGKPIEEKTCLEKIPEIDTPNENISIEDTKISEEEKKTNLGLANYLTGIIIAVFIGQIFGYRFFYRKYSFKGGVKKFPTMIMLLVSGGGLVIYGALSFTTGRVIDGIKTNSYEGVLWFPIFIILAILIFFSVKFILKRNKKIICKDGLSRTIGLEVYSSNGEKIGKIKEIYLEDEKSKIYGWLIKADKKFARKINHKKILILQKNIESIKEVMIVNLDLKKIMSKIYKPRISKDFVD